MSRWGSSIWGRNNTRRNKALIVFTPSQYEASDDAISLSQDLQEPSRTYDPQNRLVYTPSSVEDDFLLIKYKGATYSIRFPAYSIEEGKLQVRDVKERVAAVLDLPSRTKMRLLIFTDTTQTSTPSTAFPNTPIDKLKAIANNFHDKILPLCNKFIDSPPTEEKKKQFEHVKLSEIIMNDVLLKLDAVVTDGDDSARQRRKELVREAQAILHRLDAERSRNWQEQFQESSDSPESLFDSQDQKSGPIAGLSHEMSYVDKIRARVQDTPEVFEYFLEILYTFEQEPTTIEDIYQQIETLFHTNPDLAEDFKQFIPRSAARREVVEKVAQLIGASKTLQTPYNTNEEMKVAAPPTDSGYASAGIGHEKTRVEEDEDAKTIITNFQELDIQEDLKKKLTATFAEELCRSLETAIRQHPYSSDVTQESDSNSNELVAQLLKEFSMKLRYTAHNGQQQDAVVFIRQQRRRIAASFEKNTHSILLEVDEENQHIDPLNEGNGLNWKEKFARWNITDPDSFEDPTQVFQPSYQEEDIDDEEYSISQYSEAYKFLIENQAYQWLVERLKSEFHSTTRKGTVLNGLRSQVLKALASSPQLSGYNINYNSAKFKLMWNPMEFLKRQFPYTPTPILGDVIVLNGNEVNAQCSTCVLLSDKTNLQITLEESVVTVNARGSEPTLADIGEILAWIVAALRESPREDSMMYSTPFKGCPILKRKEEERGLEIPLGMMAGLGRTPIANVFDYGLVIKGFSTMFVPTKRVENSINWHFLFHEDECHISHLEAGQPCNDRVSTDVLDVSSLEDSRNFLGWSSSVQLFTGCALEKVSISGGKIINAGITFARGTKDTPLYLSRSGTYEQEIHHAKGMNVILYDMRDRRGWLIDGASALLHVTYTQLNVVWDHKIDLQQFQYAEPENGASAASMALLDQRNRNMVISEDTESWEEVTTTIGDPRKGLTSSGTNLRFTDREKLEGFAFMDIVDGPGIIRPRVAILKPSGRGWVDFSRSIHAITLLGKGFGELIRPVENSNRLCKSWQHVPIGNDYLIACITKLKEICRRGGDADAVPLELSQGIYWHKAHLIFESCSCKDNHTGSVCDRVQVLLPPSLGPKMNPLPFNYLDGAVIFGRSRRLKWSWPNKGHPTQGGDLGEEEDGGPSTLHDSGIGTSIPSSLSNGRQISSSNLSQLAVTSNLNPSSRSNSPIRMSEGLDTNGKQNAVDFRQPETNGPPSNLRDEGTHDSASPADNPSTIPEQGVNSRKKNRTWEMLEKKVPSVFKRSARNSR
ncbi:hypothetical protein B7463_g10188, partial [Scytalidium lignicola]